MSEKDKGSHDETARAVSRVGIVLLTFFTGVLVAEFRTFPYDLLFRGPFEALRTMQRQDFLKHARNSVAWTEIKGEPKASVVRHDATRAYAGVTLVVEPVGSTAYLIDMDGKQLHRWKLPFYEAFPDPQHVANPRPEDEIFWARAQLEPDGSLFVVYNTELATPYGYGFAKIDKDSKPIWTFADQVHHRFERQPDGSIYLLTHRIRDLSKEPLKNSKGRGIVLDDDVVRLSADGKELWRASLLDAIDKSDFAESLFSRLPDANWDWLHTNAVRAATPAWAAHHRFAEPGHLMLSIRTLDALALLDPKSSKITWASRGFWVGQHDPDMFDDGTIMIFDNLGAGGRSGLSRVSQFNPSNGQVVWSYEGTPSEPLSSDWGSCQQVLPNDNVLIVEAERGRVIEVTRGGDIVWEFFSNAQRTEEGVTYRATLGAVERYSREQLTFLP